MISEIGNRRRRVCAIGFRERLLPIQTGRSGFFLAQIGGTPSKSRKRSSLKKRLALRVSLHLQNLIEAVVLCVIRDAKLGR